MDIFIQKLPKVEIHLHLEAAFSLETLWNLIKKYGGDHEVMDMNNLRDKFIFISLTLVGAFGIHIHCSTLFRFETEYGFQVCTLFHQQVPASF